MAYGSATAPRDYKCVADPGLNPKKFKCRLYRYYGICMEDKRYNYDEFVTDPRPMRKKGPRSVVHLEMPNFKVDENWELPCPQKFVSFSNLNDNVDEAFLKNMCDKCGSGKGSEFVDILLHGLTGRRMGLAHVMFKSVSDARKCVEKYNKTSIMGQVADVFLDDMGKKVATMYEEKMTADNQSPVKAVSKWDPHQNASKDLSSEFAEAAKEVPEPEPEPMDRASAIRRLHEDIPNSDPETQRAWMTRMMADVDARFPPPPKAASSSLAAVFAPRGPRGFAMNRSESFRLSAPVTSSGLSFAAGRLEIGVGPVPLSSGPVLDTNDGRGCHANDTGIGHGKGPASNIARGAASVSRVSDRSGYRIGMLNNFHRESTSVDSGIGMEDGIDGGNVRQKDAHSLSVTAGGRGTQHGRDYCGAPLVSKTDDATGFKPATLQGRPPIPSQTIGSALDPRLAQSKYEPGPEFGDSDEEQDVDHVAEQEKILLAETVALAACLKERNEEEYRRWTEDWERQRHRKAEAYYSSRHANDPRDCKGSFSQTEGVPELQHQVPGSDADVSDWDDDQTRRPAHESRSPTNPILSHDGEKQGTSEDCGTHQRSGPSGWQVQSSESSVDHYRFQGQPAIVPTPLNARVEAGSSTKPIRPSGPEHEPATNTSNVSAAPGVRHENFWDEEQSMPDHSYPPQSMVDGDPENMLNGAKVTVSQPGDPKPWPVTVVPRAPADVSPTVVRHLSDRLNGRPLDAARDLDNRSDSLPGLVVRLATRLEGRSLDTDTHSRGSQRRCPEDSNLEQSPKRLNNSAANGMRASSSANCLTSEPSGIEEQSWPRQTSDDENGWSVNVDSGAQIPVLVGGVIDQSSADSVIEDSQELRLHYMGRHQVVLEGNHVVYKEGNERYDSVIDRNEDYMQTAGRNVGVSNERLVVVRGSFPYADDGCDSEAAAEQPGRLECSMDTLGGALGQDSYSFTEQSASCDLNVEAPDANSSDRRSASTKASRKRVATGANGVPVASKRVATGANTVGCDNRGTLANGLRGADLAADETRVRRWGQPEDHGIVPVNQSFLVDFAAGRGRRNSEGSETRESARDSDTRGDGRASPARGRGTSPQQWRNQQQSEEMEQLFLARFIAEGKQANDQDSEMFEPGTSPTREEPDAHERQQSYLDNRDGSGDRDACESSGGQPPWMSKSSESRGRGLLSYSARGRPSRRVSRGSSGRGRIHQSFSTRGAFATRRGRGASFRSRSRGSFQSSVGRGRGVSESTAGDRGRGHIHRSVLARSGFASRRGRRSVAVSPAPETSSSIVGRSRQGSCSKDGTLPPGLLDPFTSRRGRIRRSSLTSATFVRGRGQRGRVESQIHGSAHLERNTEHCIVLAEQVSFTRRVEFTSSRARTSRSSLFTTTGFSNQRSRRNSVELQPPGTFDTPLQFDRGASPMSRQSPPGCRKPTNSSSSHAHNPFLANHSNTAHCEVQSSVEPQPPGTSDFTDRRERKALSSSYRRSPSERQDHRNCHSHQSVSSKSSTEANVASKRSRDKERNKPARKSRSPARRHGRGGVALTSDRRRSPMERKRNHRDRTSKRESHEKGYSSRRRSRSPRQDPELWRRDDWRTNDSKGSTAKRESREHISSRGVSRSSHVDGESNQPTNNKDRYHSTQKRTSSHVPKSSKAGNEDLNTWKRGVPSEARHHSSTQQSSSGDWTASTWRERRRESGSRDRSCNRKRSRSKDRRR